MVSSPPRSPVSPQTDLREHTPSPPSRLDNTNGNGPVWTEDAGLDNPAFEESTEEDSEWSFRESVRSVQFTPRLNLCAFVSVGVVGLECVVPRVKRPLSNPCIHLLRSVSSTSSGWDCPESPPLSAEEGMTALPPFVRASPREDDRADSIRHGEHVEILKQTFKMAFVYVKAV